MVLVHEIFFITSFILKDMHFDIFKFVHEKMKYDFDPKVLHFLPFLWNKYQYETKKERNVSFRYHYSIHSIRHVFPILLKHRDMQQKQKIAERPRFKRQIFTYSYAWTQSGRKYIIMFHFIFIKRIFIHATIQVTISVFQ